MLKDASGGVLLKKAAGIEKASGEPNKNKVATVKRASIREIAEQKMADLNAASIEAAMRMVEGIATQHGHSGRRLGPEILWEGFPANTTRRIDNGEKSKRIQEQLKQFDRQTQYSPKEALEIVKNMASAKFDETLWNWR